MERRSTKDTAAKKVKGQGNAKKTAKGKVGRGKGN
jgi:hypothetical protein